MAVKRVFYGTLFLALAMTSFMVTPIVSSLNSSIAVLITVDQSGNGDYMRIQDAIDAVPPNNLDLVFILIKPGIYKEKIVVPMNKPFITLSGAKKSTIITWDEPWKVWDTPTVSILASDVVARHLTIQNPYNLTAEAAVALRVAGDRVAFYGCRFLGIQDTVLDDAGRHYYKNCYFEGGSDFICGNGKSLFERCHLHSVSVVGGSITAQRRPLATEDTYFIFSECKITGMEDGKAILGRPWAPYSTVVFAFSHMTNVVLPQGWGEWPDEPSRKWTTFYGQHKCYGPGADVSRRVPWSHQLSETEAAPFLNRSCIIGPEGQEWLRPPPKHFKKASDMVAKRISN